MDPGIDVTGLLRRAAELVPAHARSETGHSAADVRDYLDQDEWEIALAILQDFEGVDWQPRQYWDLLTEVAEALWLKSDAAWCHWRASETEVAILLADLQLVSPEDGGRRTPVPSAARMRPMWSIGRSDVVRGYADLHVGFVWVDGAPRIEPGARGRIRILPLQAQNWRHLMPGDVIAMHEARSVAGIATITKIQFPS